MRSVVLALILLAHVCISAQTAEKPTLLLDVVQLAATGADAYATDRNRQTFGFHEFNPVARPFVRNRPTLIAYFSIQAAVKIVAVHWLRPRHRRLAITVRAYSIADNAAGAAWSLSHH
jgi:hypothetical protein